MTKDAYDIEPINPEFQAATEEFMRMLNDLDVRIMRGFLVYERPMPQEFIISDEPGPLRDHVPTVQLSEHPKDRRRK